MTKYLITHNSNNCFEYIGSIPFVGVANSYLDARRAIQNFTKNWDVKPVLAKKILPIEFLHKIGIYDRVGTSVPIASFKGTTKDGIEIRFGISLIKFKM